MWLSRRKGGARWRRLRNGGVSQNSGVHHRRGVALSRDTAPSDGLDVAQALWADQGIGGGMAHYRCNYSKMKDFMDND